MTTVDEAREALLALTAYDRSPETYEPGDFYLSHKEAVDAFESAVRGESFDKGYERGRAEGEAHYVAVYEAKLAALREAAVALCQLWFTDNAPDGSQHIRKAMLDLRTALAATPAEEERT